MQRNAGSFETTVTVLYFVERLVTFGPLFAHSRVYLSVYACICSQLTSQTTGPVRLIFFVHSYDCMIKDLSWFYIATECFRALGNAPVGRIRRSEQTEICGENVIQPARWDLNCYSYTTTSSGVLNQHKRQRGMLVSVTGTGIRFVSSPLVFISVLAVVYDNSLGVLPGKCILTLL